MKKAIKSFLMIFLITVIARSSVDGKYFTVQSVRDIIIPYIGDLKTLSFILLSLNIALIYLFLSSLVETTNSFFEMESYFITRAMKEGFYKVYLKLILKEVSILSIIFFINGIIFTLRYATGVLTIFEITISVFLTLIIWGNCLFLLKVYGLTMKSGFFLIFTGIILSQFLSRFYSLFSLLVIGSLYFEELISFIFVGKIIIIIVITILCWLKIKTYEAYGGKDD